MQVLCVIKDPRRRVRLALALPAVEHLLLWPRETTSALRCQFDERVDLGACLQVRPREPRDGNVEALEESVAPRAARPLRQVVGPSARDEVRVAWLRSRARLVLRVVAREATEQRRNLEEASFWS